MTMLKAVWQYRDFIISSIKNDFKARYVRSKLGGLWVVVQPLTLVLIYALVLSTVIKAKLPETDTVYAYPIYLTAGMLAWTLFVESVTRSLNLFLENGNMIKKIAFPKLALPLITLGTVSINGLVLLVAIFGVFAALGHTPGIQALWIPPLFVLTLMFGMSIGLVLGVLNVFLRDIGQLVPVVLQFGFWLTPIVYTINIIPAEHQHWFQYNPMAHVSHAFQEVLLYNRAPDLSSMGILFAISIFLLGFGVILFKKASAEMVDLL